MKIPKAFHPVLVVLIGTILFLAGIALLSVAFVAMYKAIEFTAPLVSEALSLIMSYLSKWLPL